MSSDEIQKKIKLAHEIVKNEHEPYKIEAFKVVLQYLLQYTMSNQRKDNRILKTIPPGNDEEHIHAEINIQDKLKKLANNCKITVDQLKDIITIKNGKIELLYPIKGNEAEKQTLGSQCILVGYEEILEKEWVASGVLKECLRDSGIEDVNRILSKNLKKQESIFRMRGSTFSSEYKLTSTGRISAYKIIKQLSVGE